MLQNQQQQWQILQVQTTAWLTLLTRRALELNQAQERLANLQKTWIQTRAAAQLSKAPDAILEQINASLANIDAAQTPLDAQRASLLDLQSRVSEEVSRCGTALSQIAVAQQKEVGGIFARDGLPIWSSDLHAHARAVVPTLIRKIAASCWADLYRYLSEPSKGLLGQAGLFVLLLLILLAVRRQVRHWTGNGQETTSAMAVFERPYAAALIVTMLWASSPHSQTPPAVRDLFNILVFLPMLRLLQQVVDPKAVPGVFVLGVLVSFDNLRQAFLAGVPLLEQAVLLLEMFIGMAVGVRSLTVGLFRRESAEPWVVPRLGALRVGVVLVLMVLATSAVAGSFGYMSLARLLASSILMGFALALGLYALFRVLSGIVAFSFRVWPLRLLRMVQSYRDMLERRTCRISALVDDRCLAVTLSGLCRALTAGDISGNRHHFSPPGTGLGQHLPGRHPRLHPCDLDVLSAVLLHSLHTSRRCIPSGPSGTWVVLRHFELAALRDSGAWVHAGLRSGGSEPHPGVHHGWSAWCWHRLRSAERGEQLCLRVDPAPRAAGSCG